MAYFKITVGASNAAGMLVNATNRLRLAKSELEMVNALIQNMDDTAVAADLGFTGTGNQLRITLAGVVAALNDADVDNLLETLNW